LDIFVGADHLKFASGTFEPAACDGMAAVLFVVLGVLSLPKGLNRILSKPLAVLAVGSWEQRQTDRGWQGKSAAVGLAHVVDGVEVLRGCESYHAVAALQNLKQINVSRAVGF
jgi:hypothetical protein